MRLGTWVYSTYEYFCVLSLSITHLQIHTTYLISYLLTPWSRVLVEKLTGSQLVKKFPAFTNARHLSLS